MREETKFIIGAIISSIILFVFLASLTNLSNSLERFLPQKTKILKMPGLPLLTGEPDSIPYIKLYNPLIL